jgi:predicted PhzF superfamily epimerase YddE/YHI9
MRLPVRFVCAFSDVPHHGNPAAVVLLDDMLGEAHAGHRGRAGTADHGVCRRRA